jgi:type II secretion system protein J
MRIKPAGGPLRRGFTLLEVLLAIGLTGVVGIAAISLQTMQARVGTATRAQEEALAEITETLRLLDDDLVLALPAETRHRFQVEEGALRLLTSCRLPGDERGVHEVRWSFDAASGALLRSSTPRAGGPATVRSVGRLWQACAFRTEGEALWLEGRLGANGQAWRLPLWTETP